MNPSFEIIKQALEEAGLNTASVHYSFTLYSLNTDLSFKFKNLKEFLEFLDLKLPKDNDKINGIKSILADHRIFHDKSFYVNFYKPKVTEL